MIFAEHAPHSDAQKTEDARDLQLRLYREIGISAVAAALNVNAKKAEAEFERRPSDLPAISGGEELAA